MPLTPANWFYYFDEQIKGIATCKAENCNYSKHLNKSRSTNPLSVHIQNHHPQLFNLREQYIAAQKATEQKLTEQKHSFCAKTFADEGHVLQMRTKNSPYFVTNHDEDTTVGMMMHTSQELTPNSHHNDNNHHDNHNSTTLAEGEVAAQHAEFHMGGGAGGVIHQNGTAEGKEAEVEEDSDDEEMEADDEEEEDEEEEEEEEESGSGTEVNGGGTRTEPTASETMMDPPKLKREEPNRGEVQGQAAGQHHQIGAGTTTAEELQAIRANLQWINHQVSLLMRSLNVASCTCADCQTAQRLQQPLASAVNGTPHLHGSSGPPPSPFPSTPQNLQQSPKMVQMGNAAELNTAESVPRGRRSKYCTPEEKKAVASYVQCHGATAAARKFNIPPAVAAYYHRKEYKKQGVSGRRLSMSTIQHPPTQQQQVQALPGAELQPKLEMDQAGEEAGMDQQIGQLWQNNYSGGGGSGGGGYLRGRGRGRPKLIGDELDAELVEYIVQLKQTNPRAHITAAQALVIARKYISEKAPGILEEHGGQVKLKITWAMKLVTRVQEREREIQLGLPAGSLQLQMQRSSLTMGNGDQQQQTNAGSNASSALVNELLGQNLMGNQQLDVNALLAAAAADGQQQMDLNDAAVLNLLGMAAGGSDLFGGLGGQDQQAGPSGTTVTTTSASHGNFQQQYHQQQQRQELVESDEAIRQLLSSLQGSATEQHHLGAVQGAAPHQRRDSAGSSGSSSAATAAAAAALLTQTTGAF